MRNRGDCITHSYLASIIKQFAVAHGINSTNNFSPIFKEFIDNGGETGYATLHSVDEYKKLTARELMKLKGKIDIGRKFGLQKEKRH